MSSPTSHGVLSRRGMFEDSSNISAPLTALFSLPQNLTTTTMTVGSFPSLVCDDDPSASLKAFSAQAPAADISETETLLLRSLISSSQKQGVIREVEDSRRSSFLAAPRLLIPSQRSTANSWDEWGEVNYGYGWGGGKRSSRGEYDGLGVSAVKMKKKMKSGRRKVREPRFCFKTMSDVDVLDDGYKWRKYGQKVVKNTQHPRSYYRCTQDNCRVKKRVERLAEDPRMVITTYEGRHVHSPSHDDVHDLEASSQLDHLF